LIDGFTMRNYGPFQSILTANHAVRLTLAPFLPGGPARSLSGRRGSFSWRGQPQGDEHPEKCNGRKRAMQGIQLRLFIADDSALLRGYVLDTVREIGSIQVVGQASDAPSAIADIRKSNPDVVILDIRMPGGSGINVLKTIKSDQPAPIVVMFTNYPYPQYRKQCLAAGADYFFDKSLEFEALGAVLKDLVRAFDVTHQHQGD
jgi:CheY-like chemotaxis protein